MVPFGLLPILLSKLKWRDGSTIILGLAILLCGCIIKINYHYADPESPYQYFTGSILLFGATMVIETAALTCATKSMPPYFVYGYWNIGLFSAVTDNIGRVFGDCAFTAYSYFDSHYQRRAQPFYTYTVSTVVVTLVLVGTIVLHRRLEKHVEMSVQFGY